MESWTGSRIYQLMTGNIVTTELQNIQGSSNFNQEQDVCPDEQKPDDNQDELIVEI